MKKIWCCFLLAFNYALSAQNADWENPRVFAINKEDARTTAMPYSSESLAVSDSYEASPYYKSLNGDWSFKWLPKPSDIPSDFYKEGYNTNGWGIMPVPGNWEFNGHGIPIYTNITYPFPKNPPFVDQNDNPVGLYRQNFAIGDDWQSRRVFLHFEGGTTAMYVWINGEKVGYTENSKSPAEFDITDYVRVGDNLLALQVFKYSDGSYLEDQDMWRLGGINRSVYLFSTDQTRIQDFFAHLDLDSNYKKGILDLDVKLRNYTSQPKRQTVEMSVLDKSGKRVLAQKKSINIPVNDAIDITLSGAISNVRKWSAEIPNLYTLLLTLKDEKGTIVESTSHKIGFRKIEIKDAQLFINGQKVYFKGVNMHEFNAETGQVLTREAMIRNLQLMKELNINAVRTSHYPQSPLWYQLCDEYGIYLVDEANLESHGLGYGPDNVANFPEWHAAHMDRIVRLVERDKNHPSVIFWSLGNEASNGKAFFDMYDWVKERDKSRPVQYEQSYKRSDGTSARNTDIICPMYPSYESMIRDAKIDLGRPYITCEYAHAMGNSMGNFQEYWDVMRSSKNMQGGFIWEWYNQGFKTKDEQGREYWAYGGDLKAYDRWNDENFCMDGIISPDQNYLPHTYIVKKVYQNILFEAKDLDKGIITVINDYNFIDLTKQNYSYEWQLLKNGKLEGKDSFDVIVPANSRKDIKLTLPPIKIGVGDEYYLQVYVYTKETSELLPVGFNVAKEEFYLGGNDYFAASEREGIIKKEKSEDKITVNAGSMSYDFSTEDGKGLLGIKKDDKEIFNELPELNFWRAPNDNEFGAGMQYKLRLWDAASHNMLYRYKGMKEMDGAISFDYEVKLQGIEAKVNVSYMVNKDGSLTVNNHYIALSDELPEMMRFGMIMTLSQDYNLFTWYGRGPHENYIDRNTDTFMGIWNSTVQEQAFAYYRPQETGNKTDVRWMTLTNEAGEGIRIIGGQPLSVSATNNKPEGLDPGNTKKQQHWSDVIPRKETVLCVDLFQRGVAGLDAWGSQPLDQYRFMGKEYRYSYTIESILAR